jgi:DNA-directed RNA polymerase subunit RPC12/RpoP
MNEYPCADCGARPARVFTADGHYRCRPCWKAHLALLRVVLARKRR